MKILLINRFEEAETVVVSLTDLGRMKGRSISMMEGVEALYELSNDPSLQKWRDELWGNHRSLSVGDIITCIGNVFEVASIGFNHIVIGNYFKK